MKPSWDSHALLGIQAVRTLPDWELEQLSYPAAGPELALLPVCESGAEQLAASCLMMDWAYDPDYRSYTLLPHMLPDRDGKGAFFSGNSPSPEKTAEIIEKQMNICIRALRSGDKLDFTRSAGILGHFLQDITAPTHTITPIMLRELFPDPQAGRLGKLSGCYLVADDLALSAPFLAGISVKEAAFHLTNDAFWAVTRARHLLPELMAAVYRRDSGSCREILRPPAKDAAELTARAWHTIFCLAHEACPEKEAAALSPFPLSRVFPAYHHPDLYAQSGPDVFCFDEKRVPMDIMTPGGSRRFQSGFGMTGHSGMKFYLNRAFSKVEFVLGMADRESSLKSHIDLDFSVETAADWNDVFSEDMFFEAERRSECRIGPGEMPRRFSVDIREAGTLIFASRATPYRNAAGAIDFDIPDIAVLDPVLTR